VVTRVTLAMHELPETVGSVNMTIHAKSDAAYRRLIAHFVGHYAEKLFNPHWDEQVHTQPDNRFEVHIVFQGLSEAQAREAWKPLQGFCDAHPSDYEGQNALIARAMPAQKFWDIEAHLPLTIRPDPQPQGRPTDFWWAGDSNQVGACWFAFMDDREPAQQEDLAQIPQCQPIAHAAEHREDDDAAWQASPVQHPVTALDDPIVAIPAAEPAIAPGRDVRACCQHRRATANSLHQTAQSALNRPNILWEPAVHGQPGSSAGA
jgi:hypothetical protein